MFEFKAVRLESLEEKLKRQWAFILLTIFLKILICT